MARRPQAPEFDRALAMALRRLRSGERFEAEINLTLEGAGFPEFIRDQVLAHLSVHGLVSDRRAIETHLVKRSGKRVVGTHRLRIELLRRGAPEALVDAALARPKQVRAESSEDMPSELDKAVELLANRFGPDFDPGRAGRFLYVRGFDEETVEQALARYRQNEL